MHFYQKNIPDFNNATRHLTRVERSLFSDAIELYYDTEKPLVADVKKLERLLLASTEEEKKALGNVLSEFFVLTDDGFFNKRCNEEILKYQSYIDNKSKAGKASAEQRSKQKATGVEQVLNTTSTNYKPITINHNPITNNQEPITKTSSAITPIVENSKIVGADKSAPKQKGQALAENWQLPKAWGDWALTDRPELTADNVRRIAENFKDHWRANANQANAKKLDWLAAWRLWVRRQRIESTGYKTTAERREANNKRAGDEFLMGSEKIIEGEFYNA